MIEKIGHIRNPLTVIALFAGIAEVSGTIVLPLLETATQDVYVWFLMGFPCLLVMLFFVTLWFQHHVLYAPSDFRDDKVFADLFKPRVSSLDIEVSDEILTVTSTSTTSTTAPAPNGPTTDPAHQEALVLATQNGEKYAETSADRAQRSRKLRALALDVYSKNSGLLLATNVEAIGIPGLKFDGVSVTAGQERVVDVSVVHGIRRRLVNVAVFEKVLPFYDSLTEQQKRTFKFVAIVIDASETGEANRYLDELRRAATSYPFRTETVYYDARLLE